MTARRLFIQIQVVVHLGVQFSNSLPLLATLRGGVVDLLLARKRNLPYKYHTPRRILLPVHLRSDTVGAHISDGQNLAH